MKIIITVLCLVFASPAWATTQSMTIPDASSKSAQLFVQHCSICHSLPHPKRLDWPHWRSMLHVMKQRMDERGMDIANEEWRQIADYLKSHAR